MAPKPRAPTRTPMRTLRVSLRDCPSKEAIREYAHHLYIMSGWVHGRDLDNWLEAETQLKAQMAQRAPPRVARRRRIL